MKKLLYLVLFVSSTSNAQPDFFERIYGYGNGLDIVELANGNILIGAQDQNFPFGNGLYLELDTYGNSIQSSSYPGVSLYSIAEDSDSNFIISGYTSASSILLKSEPNGNTLWADTIISTAISTFPGPVLSSESSIILGYHENDFGSYNPCHIRKYQTNGINTADTIINTDGWFYSPGSITRAAEGRVISISGFGTSPSHFYLTLLDSGMNILWNKIYAGSHPEIYPYSVIEAPDSNIFVAGFQNSLVPNDKQAFLFKTNKDGDSLYFRTYTFADGTLEISAVTVEMTGHLYLAGTFKSFLTQISSVMILKTDSVGTVIWSREFFGLGNAHANCMLLDQNGNPWVIGYTNNLSGDPSEIYVLKTDTSGNATTLNINEGQSNNVLISPNPAVDYFKVSGMSNVNRITIYDIAGRIIMTSDLPTTNDIFSVARLSPGTYCVRIESGNYFYTRKLVKTK